MLYKTLKLVRFWGSGPN